MSYTRNATPCVLDTWRKRKMQVERCKTPEDFPVRDKGRSRLTNPPFITVAGELDMTKHRQRCQIPFKLLLPLPTASGCEHDPVLSSCG